MISNRLVQHAATEPAVVILSLTVDVTWTHWLLLDHSIWCFVINGCGAVSAAELPVTLTITISQS